MEMDWEWSEIYWQAITIIEAQGQLLAIRVARSPNMKQEDLHRWHRELHRMAYPKTHDPNQPVLNTAQFSKQLGDVLRG